MDKRCRTCNESGINVHTFDERVEHYPEKTLADLLLDIARIDVNAKLATTLPKQLCDSCTQRLKDAHIFVLQARDVNERLLACLRSTNNDTKQLDCLLEEPIDMPTASHLYVNIKMEAEYEDNQTSHDKDVKKDGVIDASIKENFLSDKGSRPDSVSNEVTDNSYLDPIVFAETQWDVENNDRDCYDHSFGNDVEDDSLDLPLKEKKSTEATPKRRRGRPRLDLNILEKHNSDGRYCCDMCSKTFAWRKDLQRHAKSHFGLAKYECDYCERKFLRKDKLNDHMKTHLRHGRTVKYGLRPPRHPEWNFANRLYTKQSFQLIQCKLCDSKFRTTPALREHLLIHRDSVTFQLQRDSEVVKELFQQVQSLDDINDIISEDIAQQRLTKYYSIVNEYGYEMCLSDSDADASDKNMARQRYECELCQMHFPRKYLVLSHIKESHVAEQLPYKCNVCKIEFVCEPMYRLHTQNQCRSKEKKYQCRKCPGKFMWVENLQRHRCSNRSNSPELKSKLPRAMQCNICNKTFRWTKFFKRHMKTHTTDRSTYECTICGQRFIKPENLQQHMLLVHEQLKQRFKCCLCGQKYKRLLELREHLQRHSDGCTDVNIVEGEYFKVYHQGECASRRAELSSSIAADFLANNISRFYSAVDGSGNELDLYDSETNGEDEGEHTERKPPLNYRCEICSQIFTSRKRILLHQQNEHADQNTLPHSCAECHKQFVCLSLLQQHLKRDCLNAHKKYQCEKCPARFVWAQNLQLHMQLKHIKSEQQVEPQLAKKLQCDQCDKAFIWPKDLTRHRRVHMPEHEKYDCPYCERKFNRKDNMHAHLKVHGSAVAAKVAKNELVRNKPMKMRGIDEYLCKPHGCKVIQCMICLSKHSKIADLRTHLRTHQYVVSFAQRPEPIGEISTLLYPGEPPMTESTLTARIVADVAAQQLEHFYSITNEVGYELNLNSSETESDSETEVTIVKQGRQSYTCELCDKCFPRKYKLYEHQLWSHDWQEAPHMCVHCNARFLSAELLRLHYEDQCKNTVKRYVCRKCPKKFMWKDNMKTHLRTVHAEKDGAKNADAPSSFNCAECERSFQKQKDLTRHMVMHRSDAPVIKCLWCPRRFYRKQNLHMHITRHGITADSLDNAEAIVGATSRPNGAKHIYCKVCNIKFESISALRLHLLQQSSTVASSTLSHHDFSSMLNYSITNELGFELHVDDSETDEESKVLSKADTTPAEYVCEICHLTCKRKYEMAQHQLSIHKYEQVPLKCDGCTFKTVSKEILSHHMRTQCENMEKKYKCSICAYKFMWRENLDTHISLVHVKKEELAVEGKTNANTSQIEKVFQCDKCNRRYNRKDRLTTHIKKVHVEGAATSTSDGSQIDPVTGEKVKRLPMEKKFLCTFCGRAVTSSSNLIIHMRRHTGEKPFKCEFCEMAFPRSSDLQCHRRTHTGEKPHKCTVCLKAFSRSYKLQTHMRIHSGERPYKCTYCEKSFTQSNDLTLHIRRHTGERPYVCGICGERFIQGTALKNHRTMRGHYEEVEPKRTTLLEQF